MVELDRQYLAQYAGRQIEQRAQFGRRTEGEVAPMEQILCIGRIYVVFRCKNLSICVCTTRTVLLVRSTF